ncbi:MAG: SGNH/GDSL hydrolase family protein, partial [Bacteroidales bacterium]
GALSMPHMPTTGVSGLDLYRTDCHGTQTWCSGNYHFGDTITYSYRNLNNPDIHSEGSEYTLFLPLYNSVSSLQIGVNGGQKFEFAPASQEKPIVVYGTSIAQGACASRPGMAWTNILSRQTGSPVVNLGFSGNGQLEQPLFGLLGEIDAQIYIIDCMPNMTRERVSLIYDRVVSGVKLLRERSDAPVLLAEHCGYMGDLSSDLRKQEYSEANAELKRAYEVLVKENISDVYYMTKEEQGLTMDSQVDGVHATDLGMQQYAAGYFNKISTILNRPVFSQNILTPRKQRREPHLYDWNKRHEAILARNREVQPEILLIGNSITHFWGGEPIAPVQSGAKSWNKLFGKKKVTNMGCGWDRIENVLWRVYHGELDGFNAKKIFLMAGTNNLEMNTNEEIVIGIRELSKQISMRQPEAEIYIVQIYPRRGLETRIAQLNAMIREEIPADFRVKVIGLSEDLTDCQGRIIETYFSDGLHPNHNGYEKISQRLKPYL